LTLESFHFEPAGDVQLPKFLRNGVDEFQVLVREAPGVELDRLAPLVEILGNRRQVLLGGVEEWSTGIGSDSLSASRDVPGPEHIHRSLVVFEELRERTGAAGLHREVPA
jgi:hypothetical protein